MKAKEYYSIGSFRVMPFEAVHDVECYGFIISHRETGVCMFLTDSAYSKYKFAGLNNIIIEVNYSEEILNDRLSEGSTPTVVRNRVRQSHMSLETCKELLQANDLDAVNNIVLAHLSDNNSNSAQFKSEIESVTGKTVTIADTGLVIDFNKTPF